MRDHAPHEGDTLAMAEVTPDAMASIGLILNLHRRYVMLRMRIAQQLASDVALATKDIITRTSDVSPTIKDCLKTLYPCTEIKCNDTHISLHLKDNTAIFSAGLKCNDVWGKHHDFSFFENVYEQ